MSEQANVQVVQEIYQAFGRGDVAGVLSRLSPNATLEFEAPAGIPWAGTHSGREGWGRFFQILAENAEQITLSMQPFAAQGHNVVMLGRYQGVVKRTGKRIDSPLVQLWTIRNGLAERCVEATNTAAELAACTGSAAAAG